jgi:RecB family endonuclease NucS
MPITTEQTAEILALDREGLNSQEIAQRVGVSFGQVAAVKAVDTRRRNQLPVDENEIGDAIETTFGLERDMQRALREHIEQLEPGLSLIDDGRERKVASGFIDIMARDRAGAAVVIELKAGPADRDAIGQILAYLGDVMATEKSVRGVLVAGEFTPRAIGAARAAPNIRLVRYGFSFSFETVSPASGQVPPSDASA